MRDDADAPTARPADAARKLIALVADADVGALVKETRDADVRAAYARLLAAAMGVRDALPDGAL